MRYIRVFMFLLLLGCINLKIQSQDKKWTLEECMLYAVQNSPRKNKQDAQNSIYHQNYIEAIGALLPSLQGSTNAYFNFGRGLDAETNTYTDINSFSNNYSLYTSLTLFDGLSKINRVKMQKVTKLMGKQQLQKEKDLIAYETMEAFFNVLYNVEMIRLAEKQLDESSDNLKQTKRMEELGVKGLPDVAEMSAKEAADRYNLTRQKNIHAISVIVLKEKMNFPIDQDFEIIYSEKEDLIVNANESALSIYEQAKNYNPKAQISKATIQAQEYSYKASKGNLFPTISVDAGFSSNFSRYMDGSDYISFKDQLRDRRGHYVGFTLSVPLFSGFSRTASVKRSKAQLIITRSEQEEAMRTLYSEIEQAVADEKGQAEEYKQAQKQTESMDIAHKMNQRKYTEGLISALELHTSSNRLVQAQAEELNASLKYELKHRLVNYYKGIPFISE